MVARMHVLTTSLHLQYSHSKRFSFMSDIIPLRAITSLSNYTQGDSKQILEVLLLQKRSEHTRRAYSHDLQNFFSAIALGQTLSSDLAREFLCLNKNQAIAIVIAYRNHLFELGLAILKNEMFYLGSVFMNSVTTQAITRGIALHTNRIYGINVLSFVKLNYFIVRL